MNKKFFMAAILLLITWLGITIVSAKIMETIITTSVTISILPYVGVICLVFGLAGLYILSKPLFQQITKLNILFKMIKGGGLI